MHHGVASVFVKQEHVTAEDLREQSHLPHLACGAYKTPPMTALRRTWE